MQKALAFLICFVTLSAAAIAGTLSARTPGMLVQTEWLAAHLNDKSLVILHVGADRAAYDAQHIPGARFLALSELVVTRNGVANEVPDLAAIKARFERLGVGDQSRVVLYGERSGLLAARAYFTLDYVGHGTHASMLDGGLEKWSAEHRTVSNTAPHPTPAHLTVKAHPELVVDIAAVKQIVLQNSAALLDARPQLDFAGSPSSARSGHIPGAKNVYWMTMLAGRDIPVLKPLDAIRAAYAAAGVRPGAKAVVYCQTGMQAAHAYFTLKLAGFRPVLYDGSFSEWSNASDTRIETGATGSR